jgi:hypothetical protein
LNSKQTKQENTKQNFKFRSGKDSIIMNVFCIVIESFTWTDFVTIRSWISRASLPLGSVRAVAGRICAKRATRRRRTSKRNDNDDKKQTKTQNKRKIKPSGGRIFHCVNNRRFLQRVLNK